MGWCPCGSFLAPNSSFVSVSQTAPQKAQLNKAASISIPLLTKLQIKRGKRGGLGTHLFVTLGSVGDPHIQEKIGVLDSGAIWLDQLGQTMLWPHGITTQMGIRYLSGNEISYKLSRWMETGS